MQDRIDLDSEIEAYFADDGSQTKQKSAERIRMVLDGIRRKRLGISGEVKMFGSYSNGFQTGTSDLDVVLVCPAVTEKPATLLQRLAAIVPEFGFTNVTKITQANVPLVKFVDRQSGIEVDFCINNDLGVRNSLLLLSYCKYDSRVLKVGRMVKEWAKRHELVGTADGYLNSYAYMLLTIHYLQSTNPPVVPNLQMMATEPVPVSDSKWSSEDVWETKFVEDVDALEKSRNTQSVSELLIGFFEYYTEFNWRQEAVCMRLNGGQQVAKFTLHKLITDEQWYVEDPFDLKHNLAAKCTRAGRLHIIGAMRSAYEMLKKHEPWSVVCPPPDEQQTFFLKCRINDSVTPEALLEEFADCNVARLHFPEPVRQQRGLPPAFLEFERSAHRRRAHTKNETFVEDIQLQLHYSSEHAKEAMVRTHGYYTVYDAASAQMGKQLIAARARQEYGGGPQGKGSPVGLPQYSPDLASQYGFGWQGPGMMPPQFAQQFHGAPRQPMPLGQSPWDTAMLPPGAQDVSADGMLMDMAVSAPAAPLQPLPANSGSAQAGALGYPFDSGNPASAPVPIGKPPGLTAGEQTVVCGLPRSDGGSNGLVELTLENKLPAELRKRLDAEVKDSISGLERFFTANVGCVDPLQTNHVALCSLELVNHVHKMRSFPQGMWKEIAQLQDRFEQTV